MEPLEIKLPAGKKLYFASDFHLGVPDPASSLEREQKICRWLDQVSADAHTIFLMGDVFDFWFEYKKVIPKGFLRFQGKIAELADRGIRIVFFHGNHDMWMFDYFRTEIGASVYSDPIELIVDERSILIGHGDGLGPGDRGYKILRSIFRNPLSILLFKILPPRIGMGIAHRWSRHSRITSSDVNDNFDPNKDYLYRYCQEVEKQKHFDAYVFGHRHLVIDQPVGDNSRYINLGEWVHQSSYLVMDNEGMQLLEFEK